VGKSKPPQASGCSRIDGCREPSLGVGVLVDAFVVRMTLVPATLALLGHTSWWLPRRLDRALPHLDSEGTNAKQSPPPAGSLGHAKPPVRSASKEAVSRAS
jgi:RND superfamily putative drug exporter